MKRAHHTTSRSSWQDSFSTKKPLSFPVLLAIFLFSLYADDLIEVEHKRGLAFSVTNKESTLPPKWETKETLCYYEGMNIAAGSITVCSHDNSYILPSLGVKTLNCLKKYEVDILGNVREVKKENRQSFR